MRKLAVFFTALVLSLALLVTAGVRLLRSQTEVEVREVVFSGSRDAAHGLTVDLTATVQPWRLLAFDIRLPLAEGALAPETDFVYDPEFVWNYDWDRNLALTLRSFGMSVSSMDDVDLLDGSGVTVNTYGDDIDMTVAGDVAARTDPGTVRTEWVPLRNYMDAFTWTYAGSRLGVMETILANDAKLSRLFYLEVPENCCLQVRIAKTARGAVVNIQTGIVFDREETKVEPFESEKQSFISTAEGLSVDGLALTAQGDGGVWAYPSVRDSEGREQIDYALGPGLTFIPFRSENYNIDMEHVRVVYPTDEEPLRVTLDGGVVELVTRAGEDYALTAVDEESKEVLSRVTLFENVPAGTRLEVVEQDDLRLYVVDDGRFVLTKARRGVVLTGRLDTEREYAACGYTHTMLALISEDMTDLAWDGTRLAIAHGNYQEVAVYDAAGLLYHAFLDYSPIWNARHPLSTHGDAYPDRYKAHPMRVSFEN